MYVRSFKYVAIVLLLYSRIYVHTGILGIYVATYILRMCIVTLLVHVI